MDDLEPLPEPEPGLQPIKTYSLEEVVALIMPNDDPKNSVRWLTDQIRAGNASAYNVRRRWRMTHQDVEDLIERRRNKVKPWTKRIVAADPEPESDIPIINGLPYGGLSRRSWLYHTRANVPGTSQYNRRHGIRPPPEPPGYKKVKPEAEAVIHNMPTLSAVQRELLDRVQRERQVVVGNEHRKTVESLVRRNLVDYTVASHGRGYQFTVRTKDS